LLSNRHIQIPQVGVTLIGLECPWRTTSEVQSPPPGFSIGLTHTPDNILELARYGVDIAFAGHTHGGRLRLPLIGSLLVPCRLGRFLDAGWFVVGRTLLCVTRGIGYFPSKQRRPGELLKITLRGRIP
jgi:predicted MPP superfamily phosphohydrolase